MSDDVPPASEHDEATVRRDKPKASTSAGSASAPTQIGPYRILEQIGEGGMGVVYLAEQTEPVRRRVAIKIIKLGMDTKQVVARFEAERQALAMMDHPNVAKIFDGGATEQGRPYFVMEHVAGVPITEHCDRQRLGIVERLHLFIRVCEAVQHAHQKGVIHRDLKPSNILVTVRDGRAVPKVIDFGVAKAVHQKLTERTLFTEQGQLIGTPEYMSPEQAEMTAQDIDTRSDIYSLGVLLYELLTGTLPFDARNLREEVLVEIQRIIREEDPPKPSTRLSSSGEASSQRAKRRRADPNALTRTLRGDLDWIVMKCLEKDRTRRYETASGLAADLQRHLDDEPVLAGPPGAGYRVGKFVRRHRLGVTAAAAVLLVLLAGIAGTTWGLLSAVDARDAELEAKEEAKEQARLASEARDAEAEAKAEAQQRADELEQVAEFQASQLSEIDVELMAARLREDLLVETRTAMERTGLDEEEMAERTERLEALLADANFTNVALKTLDRNIFERALAAVDEQFAEDDLVRARLLQTIAETLREIGLLDDAMAPQTEALAIRRRVLEDDHPETLDSVNNLGTLLWSQGKLAEAEPYWREALEANRRVLGDDHPDTLNSVASMGVLLGYQGKLGEAESFLREALEGFRRVRGDDHADTLACLINMGSLLRSQGKEAEAEPYWRDALERCRRVLGDDHPHTLTSMSTMGLLLQGQGKLAEAEPYSREAVEGFRRVLGDDHPSTLKSVNNLGILLDDLGKLAEAESFLREAVEGSRRVHGDDHPETLTIINNMGALLNAQRRYDESEPLVRESVKTGTRVLGADRWRVAEARSLLGEAIAGQQRYEEAEPLLLEGHAGLDAAVPPVHRSQKLSPAIERLVRLYEAWGKPDKAAEWRAKLEELTGDGAAEKSSEADD